ncbi:MAG: competence/damage-inducible protein A [Alphaproteobacteria bacterium]|nr:competence/damage-inducible protein A [Alphaproteobacteria bacterium]
MPYQPTAAIIVIGNEILSGRTQDTNIAYIGKRLGTAGIDLLEVRVIPDDEQRIIKTVNEIRPLYTYVFTTGGIGATHDDITAECIAKAFGRKLIENQEALAIIMDHYKGKFYQDQELFNGNRSRMAMMPEDVTLIKNPVSKAPSFQIENVYVLAGMPSVMQGMLETILPKLQKGEPFYYNTVTSNLLEGTIADRLTEIQNAYPMLSIGSYPFYQVPNIGTSLVIRGQDKEMIQKATNEIIEMVKGFGATPQVERQI